MLEPLVGFLIALAIGLTGIGAGTITAPVLMLFLGVPAAPAVATALVFGATVKLVAAPVYVGRRQVDRRALGYLCLGGLPAVVAGTLLLHRMDGAALHGPVLALVGATVVVAAAINLWRARQQGPSAVRTSEDHAPRLAWAAAPIGLEVGFSSAGAGALGTLALLHWTTLTPAQVVGTDLLFGLALATVGGALHVSLHGVPLDLLGRLLLGGVPAALLGAHLATRVPARPLRLGLCVWLVWLGSQLFYRGVRVVAWGTP